MQNKKILNKDLGRLTPEDFKQKAKTPVVVVLDNIRSLNNVGSVFRTADAFAIQKVLLCGITAQPPHREINKTALGATETVEWQYFKKTIDAINNLKDAGYKVLVVEQVEHKQFLQDVEYNREKIALVFGNEVSGVVQEIVDNCSGVIEIPQFGTKHSLNISVSVGVVLWQFVSQIIGNDNVK